jgi:Flp pilus assembly protein TadD
MAWALRVRVTWDDTIVEDRVFAGRKQVRTGAGGRAHAATPGEAERYASLTLLPGGVIELVVQPGAAAQVIFPGEPAVELGGETFRRALAPPFGSGRLVILRDGRETIVEFERVTLGAEHGDRALWAWAAAAMVLATLGAGSYRLVKRLGDGHRHEWGPPRLTDRDVTRVRVQLGPDGIGASRPQAGTGATLHGSAIARRTQPSAPERVKPGRRTAAPSRRARPQRGGVQLASRDDRVTLAVRVESKQPEAEVATRTRTQALEDGQAALLAADLRKAIDSYSSAEKSAPLDYDQLNWLGLAHYLSGEYDEARGTWERARGLQPGRADAINNLASVAKRRGDTASELALLAEALAQAPGDCHASNSLALAQAKRGDRAEALKTLAESDASCGGEYAYTSIQKAGILALDGEVDAALKELERGLERVDTLVPVKEFEVMTDLKLDPAFARLRMRPEFAQLVAKYLPRAAGWQGGGR